MRPWPCRPHDGDHPPRQIVPAEEIRVELSPQHVRREILDRPGLAIGAVVEQRVERSTGSRQHLAHQSVDRGRPACNPSGRSRCPQPRGSSGPLCFPDGREDPPSLGFQGAGAIGADAARRARDDDAGFSVISTLFLYKGTLPSHIRFEPGRKDVEMECRQP